MTLGKSLGYTGSLRNLPISDIKGALAQLPKHERKRLARAARRAEVENLHVIPLEKERELHIVLQARRKGSSEWRILSRLFDINLKLRDGKWDHARAQLEADFIAARWQAQDMHAEVKVLWRYGKPLIDHRPPQQASAKSTQRGRQAQANPQIAALLGDL
jgi:hypothetical protein